ncbi:hypothetical protein M2138_001646 [Dysgonomonadaceae bacterium PH5-43]|nr:hypothetical protein [Dysgonomonadaceae bacterium PH5-43]
MEYKNIDLSKYKIVIFTRSMNAKLFELSSQLIGLPFKHIRLKHTSAISYFYDIMKYDIDYAINIDEDAFVSDPNKLLDFLKYVIANNYVNCGFPDGGILPIRNHNPLVTNPFFNILNIKEIKKNFNVKDVENFDFTKYDYEKYAPNNLYKSEYQFDVCEPYYSFFLWLSINYKTLYMDAETHADGCTSILKDMNGEVILLHSWYSRFYGKDEFHTKRINNLVLECSGNSVREFNKLSDRINSFADFLSFYYSKLKLEIRTKLKKFNLIDFV